MHLRIRPLTCLIATAFVLVTACSSSPPAASGCSGTEVLLVADDTLTVGVDFAYPPFAFEGPDGERTGFEVDLVDLIAKKLDLELLLVNRTSAAIVPGLLAHRLDLVATGLRETGELRDETCTSQTYLPADLAVLVPRPDPHGIGDAGDLDGRLVGVQYGSRSERWARSNLAGSEIRPFPTNDDLLAALAERDVQAVVSDLAFARYTAKRDRHVAVEDVIQTGESYVLAAGPDNGALIARVNGALRSLDADGQLSKLRERWFGS